MNKKDIIRKLIALRYLAEREAEAPIQQIECTLLCALNDVCNAFDMTHAEKRRVMGPAFGGLHLWNLSNTNGGAPSTT